MAEVTNDLIFEVLKQVPHGLHDLKEGQKDIKNELIGVRQHQHASQGEINNVYGRLATIEHRLDRIEDRLNIVAEPAE